MTVTKQKKGIILFPPFQPGTQSPNVDSSRLSSLHTEISRNLLYFDHIVYPRNHFTNISLDSPEIDFLTNRGVFSQEKFPIENGSFTFDKIIDSVRQALQQKSKNDSAGWAVADRSLRATGRETLDQRSIFIDLIGLLPVPDDTVPWQDVLEFKDRFEDALVQLRHSIEKLYLQILGSPDRSVAENNAYRDIAESVRLIKESFDSRNMKSLLTSMSIGWEIPTLVQGAITIGSALFLPAPIAAIAGNVAGAIGATRDAGISINVAKSPFAKAKQGVSPDFLYIQRGFYNGILKV